MQRYMVLEHNSTRYSQRVGACAATESTYLCVCLHCPVQVLADPARRALVTEVTLTSTALDLGSLAQLPCLMRLNLSGCGLSTVPAALSQLSVSLTHLDLGSNSLQELPKAVCSLTNLQLLNLQGNQLTSLPSAIGNLQSLRLLGLKSNQLAHLPESFSRLTALVELFITDNRLEDLPEGMSACTSLVKLQVRKASRVCPCHARKRVRMGASDTQPMRARMPDHA